LRSRGIDTRWVEYHSSLKDLTGLWFKAALIDVMDKEDFSSTFYDRLVVLLRQNQGACWRTALEKGVALMKSKKWDRLWDYRGSYSDDLEDLHWRALWAVIVEVETALANYLELDFIPKLRQRKVEEALNFQYRWAPIFQLPHRSERVFLHFPNAMPWEGRYDTMVEAIRRNDPFGPWIYLIEHRFN
jgi:hypothetical protein